MYQLVAVWEFNGHLFPPFLDKFDSNNVPIIKHAFQICQMTGFFRLLGTLNNVNLQPRLPINYSERSCQFELTASFSNKHCNFRHWNFGLSQWRQIYLLCSTLQIWKMMALSKNVFERPFMYKEQAVLTLVYSWFINLEIKNCFSCQTFYNVRNATWRNGHCSISVCSKFCSWVGTMHFSTG